MSGTPRDVVVTAFTPNRRSGTGLRTCGVIAALAARRPVDVHYVPFGDAPLAEDLAELPGVALHRIEPGRGLQRLLPVLQARRRGAPMALARTASRELVDAAGAAGAADRLIADGPSVGAALLAHARRRPVVYLAHNLESGFREGASLRTFERRLLRAASESWMTTRADMQGARALAGDDTPVRYVPNAVDLSRIRPVSPTGGDRILFVGDFEYEPNRDGLAFLLGEVMPLLWAVRPRARLVLVGRGLADVEDDRVDVLGFVDDLEAVYASVDAVAVPLRRGGGSPLKFIEALAHGLPVVASAHAARLVEDGVGGTHFVAAADARSFADGLAGALAGEHAARGAAGLELARSSYSLPALADLLAEEAA